ncbi:MAG: glycosyltransferase family 4 protein [Deltaproteobacteria bacterium]|nr:glycosyltransferase family 4 protein [Deltaproteobacteria bacterium]
MKSNSNIPHILWITGRYPPLPGGMAVSCDRQVQGLRRRGLAIDVVALVRPDAATGIHKVDRDGGSDYLLAQSADEGTLAQRIWRLVLETQVRRPYTQVVGFGAGRAGYLAVTFAAWLDCSSLALVRGNDFDRDWFNPRLGYWVRETLSRATVIGAVSEDAARRSGALFPGRDVRFTPNGVNPGDWELLPEDRQIRNEIRSRLAVDGRRVCGLFGQLKYKKRVPLWLAALRQAGLMSKVSLLIVGRLDEETRGILADPALVPGHEVIEFSPRDRLPGLYAACDYIVLPSLFEGMPNVLLEAMALGVVPIVSSAGAMGDVVQHGETGFVFPPEDRQAAAAVTAQALALDEPELAAMGARAKDQVTRDFSIARELDILGGILGLPGPAALDDRPS